MSAGFKLSAPAGHGLPPALACCTAFQSMLSALPFWCFWQSAWHCGWAGCRSCCCCSCCSAPPLSAPAEPQQAFQEQPDPLLHMPGLGDPVLLCWCVTPLDCISLRKQANGHANHSPCTVMRHHATHAAGSATHQACSRRRGWTQCPAPGTWAPPRPPPHTPPAAQGSGRRRAPAHGVEHGQLHSLLMILGQGCLARGLLCGWPGGHWLERCCWLGACGWGLRLGCCSPSGWSVLHAAEVTLLLLLCNAGMHGAATCASRLLTPTAFGCAPAAARLSICAVCRPLAPPLLLPLLKLLLLLPVSLSCSWQLQCR